MSRAIHRHYSRCQGIPLANTDPMKSPAKGTRSPALVHHHAWNSSEVVADNRYCLITTNHAAMIRTLWTAATSACRRRRLASAWRWSRTAFGLEEVHVVRRWIDCDRFCTGERVDHGNYGVLVSRARG